MITKQKLKEEIIRLTYRVEDLEERLCPCGNHDWKQIDFYLISGACGDFDTINRYKCARCGKTKDSPLLIRKG